jgi:parallel beta-helix repeat protein
MTPRVSRSLAVCLIILLVPIVSSARPVPVSVSKISAGSDHSLILSGTNTLFSYGGNYYGQLGDGTDFDRFAAILVSDGEMHTDSNCFENIKAISAGEKHSLALDANGFVWAFGALNSSPYYGQLGNGDEGPNAVPVKVHGGGQGTPFLRYITGISASEGKYGDHSLAVDINHFCYAWGDNAEGQLAQGNSGADHYTIPKIVHGVNNNNYLQDINAVSAGVEFSMALDANGSVYTWGSNYYYHNDSHQRCGKLGINLGVFTDLNADKRTTPVKVHGVHNLNYLQNIIAISAGWDHSMALEKIYSNDPNCKGRVYTWGNNGAGDVSGYGGRLGDGTTHDACTPVLVKAGAQSSTNTYLENIIAISAGESHCMALDANGCVWTWGDNTYGEIGNGKTPSNYYPNPCSELVPVKVVGFDGVGYLKDIVYISAGYWSSLAVDKSGTVWMWGKNDAIDEGVNDGQFDDINFLTPVPLHIYEPNVHNETKNKWYKHIQPAINEANNGNVIEVNEGYYCEDVNLAGKTIILKSRDPNNLSVVNNTRIYGSIDKNGGYWTSIISLKNNNNSKIIGLTLIGGGEGINDINSNPLISHCRILANKDDGIYINSGGAATIMNNIISNNYTAGIYLVNNSTSLIRNNTIVGDESYINYCIDTSNNSNPEINSNILWGYGGLNGQNLTKIYFNCIIGYQSQSNGNFRDNPSFKNSAAGDYHLQSNSPCIDKGNPDFTSATEKDIDGENRKNGRIDVGADEFYRCSGLIDVAPNPPDGIVNFSDFVVLASAWMMKDSNDKFNDAVDFINDGRINYKDLKEFCNCWLYTNGNFRSFDEEDSTISIPPEEQSLPENIFYSDEQMAESQNEQQQSEQQSFMTDYNLPAIYLTCDNNAPEPNDEVTIQIHSVAPLFDMAIGIYVVGDANITTAMNEADCNNFGWDNGWSSDPYIDPNGYVYLGSVKWDADANGVIGYAKFRYHSGQVSVYFDQEYSGAFSWNWESLSGGYVPFSQETLYVSRDPNGP